MATTALSVKLVRGAAVLDLNTLPFEIGEGFTPPETLIVPQVAAGTSANRYGGATLTGRTAVNRDWSFPLHIEGSSEAQLRNQLYRLKLMLDGAGDPDYPTYLVFRPNTDTTLAPLWGQASLSYEIVYGMATISADYSVSDMRGRSLPNCTVDLQIKPYALGQAQRLCTATGGLLEDTLGSPDGTSRGLGVLEATTNKMPNPVFGNSTWNTGWTADASVTVTQNTDPNFLMPGQQSSAKIVSAAAGKNYYQTINVGNTNKHSLTVYVRRPDGAAVTTNDAQLYYNGLLGGLTYTALGNGWYVGTVTNFSGVNAGVACGIQVQSGRCLYLAGIQLEEKTYATPLAWGDLLGCAWTGTAHNSTSTRTTATVKLTVAADTLSLAAGTIRMVVTPLLGVTNIYLWSVGNAALKANVAASVFNFTDGTTSIASAAQSLVAGTPYVVYFTWGPGGTNIFFNGANVATNPTYTPPTLGANLYIGSDDSGANQGVARLSDFTVWPVALSATEVTNDYNNLSSVIGATQDVAQRVGAIPWEYSVGGDNVFSPGTGVVNAVAKYNWGVFGGIPGSAPAVTQLQLTSSQALGTPTDIWLSRVLFSFFHNPALTLFADENGTADVGTSIGDAFLVISVNTAVASFGPFNPDAITTQLMQGKEVYMFTRLKDAGANLTIALYWSVNGGVATAVTDFIPVASDGSMRLFKSLPLVFPRLRNVFTPDITPLATLNLFAQAKRTIAGAANVSMDFFDLMPRPLTRLVTSVSGTLTVMLVKGLDAKLTSATAISDVGTVSGDIFELEPGGYNIVQSLFGSIASTYPVTTTLTFTSVWVTPRYALL